MMLRRLIAVPLFVASASAAFAQDDVMCREGLFPDEKDFAVAVIGGKEPAWFYADTDGCPRVGEDCRTSSYLVPGDTIVFSRLRSGFACAYFTGSDTAGWIENKRLLLQPYWPNLPVEAWVGEWNGLGGITINLTLDLGAVHVSGRAFWPGAPGTHDWPSTHEGAIDGRLEVIGNKAKYEDMEDLCEVNFRLLGEYLVASDNRRCGGANVTFSGVYTRNPVMAVPQLP